MADRTAITAHRDARLTQAAQLRDLQIALVLASLVAFAAGVGVGIIMADEVLPHPSRPGVSDAR